MLLKFTAKLDMIKKADINYGVESDEHKIFLNQEM